MAWTINEQGFQSKDFLFTVGPNDDGCAITCKLAGEAFTVFVAPNGHITHVRHHRAKNGTGPVLEPNDGDRPPGPAAATSP